MSLSSFLDAVEMRMVLHKDIGNGVGIKDDDGDDEDDNSELNL